MGKATWKNISCCEGLVCRCRNRFSGNDFADSECICTPKKHKSLTVYETPAEMQDLVRFFKGEFPAREL